MGNMALILMVGGVELRSPCGTTDFKGSHIAEIQKLQAAPTSLSPHAKTPANTQDSAFLLGSISSTRERMSSSLLTSKSHSTSPRWNLVPMQLQRGLENAIFNFLVPVTQ